MSSYDIDVVIVGSGVAGALMANELTKAGISVAVLESGPAISPADRPKLVERFNAASARTPGSAYEDFPEAPSPRVTNPNGYYIQKKGETFGSTYERIVGGTTWHWLGTTLRLLPSDFNLAKMHSRGVDWPVDYQDLEKDYVAAEHELGVSGDSEFDLGSPRSAGYKEKPIKQSYLDSVISKALDKKSFNEIPLEVRATPQARSSGCLGSASCIPICPIKAKYDATVHIDKAKSKGAQIIEKAVVHHVDIDVNKQVKQIRYLDWSGREHKITAKRYVIAANAIETPKLLLMSKSRYAPKGVANSSDLVGRNLMDHPIQLSWARTKKPLYPFRGPLSTSGIEATRDGVFRSTRAAFRIEIGNDGWAWPKGSPDTDVQELIKNKLFGKRLQDSLEDQLQHQLRLSCLVEQLPNKKNRVVPSATERDKLGLPRPEIEYQIGEYERAGLAKAKEFNEHIFRLLGVDDSYHHNGYYGAGHIMGTYVMGLSSTKSVVDSYSRSHDHSNLFLLGSGVFPSVGTANPTLTIAALTLRSSRAVIKDLNERL